MLTDPDNDQYHNIMHILRLQSLEQTLFFAAVFVHLRLKSNGYRGSGKGDSFIFTV